MDDPARGDALVRRPTGRIHWNSRYSSPAESIGVRGISELGRLWPEGQVSVFASFSPSCKREYIEWIADAKRAETRKQRTDDRRQRTEESAEGRRGEGRQS